MFVLDTNVVSELRRRRPHPVLRAWLESVDQRNLHLSAVTIGEIQLGIEMTRRQDIAKASEIEAWLEEVLVAFTILTLDARTFRAWAKLMHGQSADLIEDAMIAATAQVHGLQVVSRNVRDFARLGVEVVDPFAG